jgi:cytochrome c5
MNDEERIVSQMKKVVRLMLVVGLGLTLSGVAYSQPDRLSEAMKSRLAPVGSVCMAGEDCAAAPVAAAPGESRSGEEIYAASCTTCHALGVAGAPKFGDADSWAAPLAKGMDTLYTHAINGFNGMPAMGLCMNCSEEEIRATVDYMVDQVQ